MKIINKVNAQEGPDPREYVIQGKLIATNIIFKKDNCFKLYNISILSNKNLLSNHNAFYVYDKKCTDEYFSKYYFTKISDLKSFQYINNKYKIGNEYYFKTFLVSPEGSDFKDGVLFISPVIKEISKNKPKDFFNFQEYNGYKLYSERINFMEFHKDYFYFGTGIIILLILGIILYKKF